MMKKITNKKMGIVALTAILLYAMIVFPIPFVAAHHTPEHSGGPGGSPADTATPITDCDEENPIRPESGDDPVVVDGDVRVKDGRSCMIDSTFADITITGDVIAGQGSTLEISSPLMSGPIVHIQGDVKTNGGNMVTIMGNTGIIPNDASDDVLVKIDGSVQITNTLNGIQVAWADIGGDAQFDSNMEYYSITHSQIDGSVQVKNNQSSYDPNIYNNFAGNTIGKNLQCSGNDNAPVAYMYGLNIVSGKAQGQCSTLV